MVQQMIPNKRLMQPLQIRGDGDDFLITQALRYVTHLLIGIGPALAGSECPELGFDITCVLTTQRRVPGWCDAPAIRSVTCITRRNYGSRIATSILSGGLDVGWAGIRDL